LPHVITFLFHNPLSEFCFFNLFLCRCFTWRWKQCVFKTFCNIFYLVWRWK